MTDLSPKIIADPARYPDWCTCGRNHPTMETMVVSDDLAYDALAGDCRHEFGDRAVLLLDDDNTRAVAGEDIRAALRQCGLAPDDLTLPGTVSADDRAVDRVRQTAQGCGLIIAVGSGTINDLAKAAAWDLDLPYWVAPTAPSMNGYTSSVAAIKVSGVKLTLPAGPPKRIYARPEVIAEAPARLRSSGFCDLTAKFVSDTDWQMDSYLFSDSYCELPSRMVDSLEGDYLTRPEMIADGDKTAVIDLFHGLLASGAAMALAGSSAPASGGEHLISHFLDMRQPITGRPGELHGLQVAVGIIFSTACYRALAELPDRPPLPDGERLYETAAAGIPAVWGDKAKDVADRFAQKRDLLLGLNNLTAGQWTHLRDLCRRVKGPDYFADLFRRAGADISLAGLNLPEDEFRLAADQARTIRERFTVLDLAAHCGALPRATEAALAYLR